VEACTVKKRKEKEVRVKIFVSGRVQGVFFRKYLRKKMREIGIKGKASNLSDGRVEVEIEGKKKQIEKMIEFCWKGPPLARVEKVETEEV
jgi:acylphosphatase